MVRRAGSDNLDKVPDSENVPRKKNGGGQDIDAEWSKCEYVVALCMRAHAKPEKPALPEREELRALACACPMRSHLRTRGCGLLTEPGLVAALCTLPKVDALELCQQLE